MGLTKFIPVDVVNLCHEFYDEYKFRFESNGVLNAKCSLPSQSTKYGATMIANTTAIQRIFDSIKER